MRIKLSRAPRFRATIVSSFSVLCRLIELHDSPCPTLLHAGFCRPAHLCFSFQHDPLPASLPLLMKASTLVRALVWVSFASAFTGIAPAASNDVQVTVERVSRSEERRAEAARHQR